MARTKLRDGGGGRRHGNARFVASAWCVLLMLAVLPGCDLNNPTSPNDPADLTGQTTNQTFTFTGSLSISSSANTMTADDLSTVLLVVEVKDSSGGAIQNLTTVNFSTNLGAFNVGGALFTAAQATTFNGLASVLFQSSGRLAGAATITASIGTVSSSTQVTLTPLALDGTLALAFGTTGTGLTTLSGVASAVAPLEANIGLTALDTEGQPIVGVNVSFRIIQDTTADGGATNPNAEFAASRHTTTGPDGSAVNILRAFGAGTVVVVAEMFDPNTGALVATSNRIILTASSQFVISLAFTPSGATSVSLLGPYPQTQAMAAVVTDTAGVVQPGLTVRFRITADSTDTGASLSSSVVVADSAGTANNSISVPGSIEAASVSILAEVINSAGTVLATSNVIVASTPKP